MKINVEVKSHIEMLKSQEFTKLEKQFDGLVKNIGNVLIYDGIKVYSDCNYNTVYIGRYEFYVPSLSIFYSYKDTDRIIIDFVTIPLNEEFDAKDIIKKIKKNVLSKSLNKGENK